ncbi:MAG: MFS transporter [Candidatus Thorarchaeota archaeon]
MTEEVNRGLTAAETDTALSKMVKQGVTVQVKNTLTESVFLVGFALLLQAPNTVIGILAAIPSVTQLLQIPAVFLVERLRNRRRLNFFTQIGNRLGILFMALIPFIAVGEIGLILLIGTMTIQSIFTAIGAPSWNSWLTDLVPPDRLGQFFSRRMALTGLMAIIVSLLGGFFISSWLAASSPTDIISQSYGYSIIFFVAFLFGLSAIYYTMTAPEPPMMTRQEKISYSQLLAEPFQDENYSKLLKFSAVWSLSTSFSAPFFTVYLLDANILGFEVAFVAGLVALTQLTSVIFYRLWGRLTDRFSNKSILQVTIPLFIIGTFLWTFSSIAIQYGFLIPLIIMIHILNGFSAAGVNLSTNNIGMRLAPRGEAASYLAARGSVIAIMGTIAPITAGILADIFAPHTIDFSISWLIGGELFTMIPAYRLSGIDFLFVISTIIGIYALHRIALVKEPGEVEERIVLDALIAETRRNVRTVSTVDGLRHTFQVPIKATKKGLKRKKKVDGQPIHRTSEHDDAVS